MRKIDNFTHGYIVAALWSTNDESTEAGGEPLDKNYDAEDIASETLERIVADCEKFQRENAADLVLYRDMREYDPSQGTIDEYAGHDFWLTRNGHGVGFWDRGLDELGDRLSDAAHKFGETNLYVGDDGKIYL